VLKQGRSRKGQRWPCLQCPVGHGAPGRLLLLHPDEPGPWLDQLNAWRIHRPHSVAGGLPSPPPLSIFEVRVMEPSTMSTSLAGLLEKPNDRGLWHSIEADRRAYGYTPWAAVFRLLTLSTWGLVMAYRVAHWLVTHDVPIIPGLLRSMSIVLWSSDISPVADIGAPLRIAHSVGIVIGGCCRIGDNCELFQNVTVGGRDKRLNDGTDAMPVIGDNVTLCAGAVVIGPLRVGDGAIVGANAVVLRDVPEYTAVAGIPAVPVGTVAVPHAVRSLPDSERRHC
jgi:serine O-acetyltransferase